jgi:hypothetical protein
MVYGPALFSRARKNIIPAAEAPRLRACKFAPGPHQTRFAQTSDSAYPSAALTGSKPFRKAASIIFFIYVPAQLFLHRLYEGNWQNTIPIT